MSKLEVEKTNRIGEKIVLHKATIQILPNRKVGHKSRRMRWKTQSIEAKQLTDVTDKNVVLMTISQLNGHMTCPCIETILPLYQYIIHNHKLINLQNKNGMMVE